MSPPSFALASGVALLVVGAGLGGATDVCPVSLRTMHLTLAAAFAAMVPLAVYVHGGRFFRKGAHDWVAWLHFGLFAVLLFLAARMVRRWWTPHLHHTAAPPASTDEGYAASPGSSRILTQYRGKQYDVTPFLAHHPGGAANLRRASGAQLEHVWKERGVEWHAQNPAVQRALSRYEVRDAEAN